MKFDAIVPAALRFDPRGLPYSPEYGDIYHPLIGAATQARHVFLAGNGLPGRWRGRERFVILETGFGLGNNFLATWNAWRHDSQRCASLHFISVEKHPLCKSDLQAVHAQSPWRELADELVQAWPPLSPDLHSLSFDDGAVNLLLAWGDVQAWLPQLLAQVDTFYLDGFAPARNPAMWEPRVYKALARLAVRGATLATWSAARVVREGLASAGFVVTQAAGVAGKRDITLASYEPAFMPRRGPARLSAQREAARHVVIVGAGLAGCAAAWALAQQGWRSVVLEQNDGAAREASGNAAGAFHGIVNRQDGAHSRFNRVAALEATRLIRRAVSEGGVAGATDGLIRLESDFTSVQAMRGLLARLGLPEDYVHAVQAEEARLLSGLALQSPAWFYPGGGWVDPGALARWLLTAAGSNTSLRCRARVARLHRSASGWQLLDARGQCLEQAQTVVLANASGALELLGQPVWPLKTVRGQISQWSLPDASARGTAPKCAVTGAGFLLPAPPGHISFGATAQAADQCSEVRDDDHRTNLARLAQMLGPGWQPRLETLSGRVGWRLTSDDRLPVIGAVPEARTEQAASAVQARFVRRQNGLYVFTALGSRGITWAPLGAKLLASLITSAPVPLPAQLVDAVDPARFVARHARRAKDTATPET